MKVPCHVHHLIGISTLEKSENKMMNAVTSLLGTVVNLTACQCTLASVTPCKHVSYQDCYPCKSTLCIWLGHLLPSPVFWSCQGHHFSNAEKVQTATLEVLKDIAKQGFQKCIENLTAAARSVLFHKVHILKVDVLQLCNSNLRIYEPSPKTFGSDLVYI